MPSIFVFENLDFAYPMAIDLQSNWQAHVAHLAMEEVHSATDATNTATVAVILFLVGVVE